MTEKPQPLSTQLATPSQTLFAPPSVPVSTHPVPRKAETVEEEEPYTIKCICNFSDDDGNTIYCETCDTWQHIECFYPNSREEALREDFAHSCADCKPRPLDRQKAIERTRRLKNGGVSAETPDKKAKRLTTKSHKKKQKPNELQLNGHPTGQENAKHGSPSDHPHPPKKAKSSHRPSHSISSQNAKRSPSYGNGRPQPNGHPPSPATTPPDLPSDFEIHNYSDGFLSLIKEQDAAPIVQTNSFASLTISNTMSLWLREPERMRQETGEEFKDVFAKLPADIDSRKRPLHVESKKLPLGPDTVVPWQYLATPAAIEKDVPLIELNGQIGFQKDYCADPANLWEELSSPIPFVFFHPMLPLYIDTRREGSLARFVRRSCKPNAVLDTYLNGQSEYHFWLVSDRYIAANEQITLPWDFRLPKTEKARILHLLGLGDDDARGHDEPDMTEAEYQRISGWVHRILSEYGGCACDLGANCAFARFHRHYQAKMQARPQKKKRKAKTHTISPTSTGHATNSRAASEGHQDDPDADGRSISERSKPPSRDRTPARQGSLDQPGILTEPTDRDKRKVQMVEDSFRRLEQQPPRKKKRTSDGTGSSKSKPKPSTSNASTGTGNYVDAGTSRSKSNSPSGGASPPAQNPFKAPASRTGSVAAQSQRESSAPRPVYCDAGVQTDPVEGEWYSEPAQTPKPRRRIISLSQRLLNNRHRLRCDEAERRKSLPTLAVPCPSSTPMDVDSPEPKASIGSPTPSKDASEQGPNSSPIAPSTTDVAMTDAPTSSPTTAKSPVPNELTVDTAVNGASSPLKTKSPELRVQMPPVPAFNGPTAGTPSATTPSSATTTVQSPFSTGNLTSPFAPPAVNGVAAHPSPVKKKLSLSDYTKSRMNKKPAGGLKTSLTGPEETKPALHSIVGSPATEKNTDALTPVQANAVNSLPAVAAHNSL
ncbi:phd finger and set domain-containing protein [Colletotrichum karsti]|uniref:Phd finger and set domain-containing protein n=1 Tax=Colletotrichum karsti TaxID=1095194 RepID=A0A9P6I0B8_9PEZI|nr:phd finger and set domain-containing protein [Colletotrichum karsti]KAF9869545.1 phd finger and set domain-containing protein [Colletotrichum karsti]